MVFQKIPGFSFEWTIDGGTLFTMKRFLQQGIESNGIVMSPQRSSFDSVSWSFNFRLIVGVMLSEKTVKYAFHTGL